MKTFLINAIVFMHALYYRLTWSCLYLLLMSMEEWKFTIRYSTTAKLCHRHGWYVIHMGLRPLVLQFSVGP